MQERINVFFYKNEDICYSDLYFLMKNFYKNLLKYAPEYTNFKVFENKTNKINQWCKYTLQSRTSCKNNNQIAWIPCSDTKKWINSYKNDHPDTDHYYYVIQRDFVMKVIGDITVATKKNHQSR